VRFFKDYQAELFNPLIMKEYRNSNGDSDIEAYETGADYVAVRFSGSDRTYTYSYSMAGMTHVENMKLLAAQGYGLNGYINRYVRFLYDR
jgi:hypothetical protein